MNTEQEIEQRKKEYYEKQARRDAINNEINKDAGGDYFSLSNLGDGK